MKSNTENATVLFKGLQGSRMYGLHNENSDYDYRQVVLPPVEELLWHDWENHSTNPQESGEDVQTYSLLSFLKGVCKPSPNMVEMLFTPENCLVTTSTLWTRVVKNRSKFLTKKVLNQAFRGATHGYLKRWEKTGDVKMLRNATRLMTEAYDLSTFGKLDFPLWNRENLKNDLRLKYMMRALCEEVVNVFFNQLVDDCRFPEELDMDWLKHFYAECVMWWYDITSRHSGSIAKLIKYEES